MQQWMALALTAILLSVALPSAFAVVSVSGLAVVDEKGEPVQNVAAGDTVTIQSNLQNNDQAEQAFVYIVQVLDENGYVIFLSWVTGMLGNNDGETLRVSWQPEREGAYTAKAFVWSSLEAPAPLTLAVERSDIKVRGQGAVGCMGSASCLTGTVTRVIDGDTIRVGEVTVRLTLVDTPERGEAGYSEATDFTTLLCPVGAEALVDQDDGQTGGSYGRMLAKVYCDGKNLNEELLRAGHAVIYSSYCDDSEFAGESWAARYC